MEFSTNKITPNDNVKIPSMNGNNSGYQLDSELREYVQAGVSGVTEQYSNLSTYAYGKRLKHEGVEYRCIVPVETPENFDPDKWVKVDLTELDKRILENASAINAIMKHTLGSPVSVSSEQYTTESDGYFVGDSGDIGVNNYCNLMAYNSISLMSCVSTANFGHIRGAVYIKKGMIIHSEKNNSNAFSYFYPLV